MSLLLRLISLGRWCWSAAPLDDQCERGWTVREGRQTRLEDGRRMTESKFCGLERRRRSDRMGNREREKEKWTKKQSCQKESKKLFLEKTFGIKEKTEVQF